MKVIVGRMGSGKSLYGALLIDSGYTFTERVDLVIKNGFDYDFIPTSERSFVNEYYSQISEVHYVSKMELKFLWFKLKPLFKVVVYKRKGPLGLLHPSKTLIFTLSRGLSAAIKQHPEYIEMHNKGLL